MSKQSRLMKIAVLDDYANLAAQMADWSVLEGRAAVTMFSDHLTDVDAVVKRLEPFDVVCIMRERTPMSREVIARLPNLKMIASTGSRNAAIDKSAVEERGISVAHTGYRSDPTIEFTWALILGSARNLVRESNAFRAGGWQQSIGGDLKGRTLGVLGLGNVGAEVARIGVAFGMEVICWSQNMTKERAAAAGATSVSKDELFRRSDILTIHVILSDRTRGLVGEPEISLMKPTSHLINTSRGPIVKESALIAALEARTIAGAALDVFDIEPLPANHPYRTLDNVFGTPHIGYSTSGLYRTFYQDCVSNIAAWIDEHLASHR
jgi:phosphoglycerate dehydrogenase-like enzyme